jgi:hypothetical protein
MVAWMAYLIFGLSVDSSSRLRSIGRLAIIHMAEAVKGLRDQGYS